VDAAELDPDPMRQLASWLDEARKDGEAMPEAMCLATAGLRCTPTARMVLMRGLDDGIVFYTDYGSDKAEDLRVNPQASVVFHLRRPAHRQVRATGPVKRTTPEESDRYWATRPEASRRSAVVSHQSTVIASRLELERAVVALSGIDPPRPDRWGGFRITPVAVEFWEEGPNRLHDRIRYRLEAGEWQMERLCP
jgi:pyridoxamine 5'-phosphate oxidase